MQKQPTVALKDRHVVLKIPALQTWNANPASARLHKNAVLKARFVAPTAINVIQTLSVSPEFVVRWSVVLRVTFVVRMMSVILILSVSPASANPWKSVVLRVRIVAMPTLAFRVLNAE